MITPSFGLTASERVLPKLALDFTTASLDSRVTFTRTGGTATRINASGLIESVAANTPRFDYDPLALVCKGLLIEEQRTNLLTYSEQFDNVAWTPSKCTVSADTVVSPDGTLNADSLVVSSVASDQGISSAIFTTNGTSAYSASIYVKKTGNIAASFYFRLGLSTASSTYSQLSFNTSTGFVSFLPSSSTTYSYEIVDCGDWWRIVITAGGIPAGIMQFHVRLVNKPIGSTVYLWGAQLEAGAFATSYIPTTTAQVTRTADVATMTGTNFSDWFNASEGTMCCTATVIGNGGVYSQVPWQIYKTTAANDTLIFNQYYNGLTRPRMLGYVSTTLEADLFPTTTYSVGTQMRSAMAYKLNDYGLGVNGVLEAVDTSASVPSGCVGLSIGVNTISSSTHFNGHIARLSYYPQRLTNAELQAITK